MKGQPLPVVELGRRDLGVTSSDVDGDSWDDLIFVNSYNGSTRNLASQLYYGTASGYSSSDMATFYNYGAYGVDYGDIDMDGYNDVLFGSYYDGSTYTLDSYTFWGSATG